MPNYKEFRIGNIFDCIKPKCAFKTFREQKQNVSRERNSEFSLPLTYAKKGENGIQYYGRPTEWESFSKVIAVVSNGVVATGLVYAQKHPTGVFGESYFLRLKNNAVSHECNLYLATVLEKVLYPKYSRENLAIWNNRVENDVIALPITATGEIDFPFMENRIRELELARIRELVAYLKITGFSDYKLTTDEEQFLENFRCENRGGQKRFKKFRLEDLFGKSTRGKRLKSLDRIGGALPFVTAGERDTGVSAFIGNDVEVFQPNTITIDMFGSAKYRNYKYGADDHIAVVHTENIDKDAVAYITASIHKVSYNSLWDYSNNFYAKDADSLIIRLPIGCDEKPDYNYMSTIVRIQKKLAIKNVVDWKDKELATYKEILH